MKLRWFSAAAVTILLLQSTIAWSRTEFFQVQNLRPGMKGVGRTCFNGNKPEEFQVEILGVLHGISPGSNAVIARFLGNQIEQYGVFEGMSGSPVYIDGKLLGAVAFSFPFSKEAIGGITPITEMVDAFTEKGDNNQPGFKVMLKKSMLWDYRSDATETARILDPMPVRKADARQQPALAPFAGHSFLPIGTPLSLAGFAEETMKRFEPQLRAFGLTYLQGAGASSPRPANQAKQPAATDNTPLDAGSNIVVPLVRGDIEASAGGTVTYIDGDRLYAFGHLLFNLGFTELPMHKGRVITVFPSLQSSFKILETLDPVGAIRQDRNSGIYGILGQKAGMIPMHIHMTTSRGMKKELNYEVSRDRFLTPFLVNFTIFNGIVSSERALGVSTLEVKGKIKIRGEQAIEIENRFSSDSNSPAYASLSIALPINFLLAAGYKNIEFEDINLEVKAAEEDHAAVLDSIRISRPELKAGETLDLNLVYSKNNGELILDSFPVKIPSDVSPGPISLLVADGMSLMSMDAREQGDDLIPRDLSQLIKFINNIRKNDHVYARLFRREPGAVVRGEGLPGLPPSIMAILKSDRNVGGINPISTAAMMEYELPPSDYIVSGSKVINLVIKPW